MLEFHILFVTTLGIYFLIGVFLLKSLYQASKKNWVQVKKNIILVIALGFAVWITQILVGFIGNYRLFGELFSEGKLVEEYHGPNDIHGDGLDYHLYKGDSEKYKLIAKKLHNTNRDIPSPSLNINNFHTVKSWSSCSTLLEHNQDAFNFAKQGAGGVRVNGKTIIQEFNLLVDSKNSICAFMYDGDDIDFWLIEPDSGTYFNLSYYT